MRKVITQGVISVDTGGTELFAQRTQGRSQIMLRPHADNDGEILLRFGAAVVDEATANPLMDGFVLNGGAPGDALYAKASSGTQKICVLEVA